MDNFSSLNTIVDLKNKVSLLYTHDLIISKYIQYENKSMKDLKKANDEIIEIETKMKQMKEKNNSLVVEIEVLTQEYKELLQKSQSSSKEEDFTEEKHKLEELKLKNDGLLNQSNVLKQRYDLMNDPGYLNSLVMYWTPQAMFKYTQAYNMQSKA